MAAQDRGHQIDLANLSTQQLSQVKKQLDDEVQHLSDSHRDLHKAQLKFRDCITSVRTGVSAGAKDKPLLVPLTSSLYVPGKLADTDHVVLDIGTGFYVEKTTKDAETFYTQRAEELGRNVKELENVVNGKANNLRMVEEVLRQRMVAGQHS